MAPESTPTPSPVLTTVRSEGLDLAVREHSSRGPGRPTVVLVHGYPDRQDVWDTLVRHLPLEDWHVVTYDVRGAGGSAAPTRRDGYRTEHLVADLVAVVDAVTSGKEEREPVHLVGHDWGSVQLWDAVSGLDPRLAGRIASFTSISGPSLDHLAWLNRHPRGRRTSLLRQLAHSWYVYAFHVPALPDLAWRHAAARIGRLVEAREGLPAGHWGPGLADDAANGLNLYRANVLPRMRHPRRFTTDVPVLVVRPLFDRFLTGVVEDSLDRLCSDVRVERIEAGHWAVVTHPEQVAALVTDHVRRHSGTVRP